MFKLDKLKAYVVDDDEVELYLTQRILKLKKLAGDIELYRSGDDLIKALQMSKFDAEYVLLNFRMNSENGLDILKQIYDLKLETSETLPYFILTSSTADLADLTEIRNDKNIDGFMYKPLVASKLRQSLTNLFQK